MEMNSKEILSVDSLRIGYGSGKNENALLPPLNASANFGELIAVIGRNGIGKSTVIEILAGKKKINLGRDATDKEIKEFFQGNEIIRYFDSLKDKKVSYKPQNLSSISVDLKVIDLLKRRKNGANF